MPVAVAPRTPRATTAWRQRLTEELQRSDRTSTRTRTTPARPREDDGSGDLEPDRRAHHPLRRRCGHQRHHHRCRPLPEAAEPGGQGDRRRSRGSVFSGGSGRPYLVEASGRTSSRPPGNATSRRRHRHLRRGELPHGPPGQPRGGHPHRRLGRQGRRAAMRVARRRAPRRGRRAQPRLGSRLSLRVFDDGWMATSASCASATSASGRSSRRAATPRRCCTSTLSPPCARRSRSCGPTASANSRSARTRRRSPRPR